MKSKRLEIQKKLFYNIFELPIFRKTQNFKGKVFGIHIPEFNLKI